MRCAVLLFAVVAVPGVAEPLLSQATTSPSQNSQAAAAKPPRPRSSASSKRAARA